MRKIILLSIGAAVVNLLLVLMVLLPLVMDLNEIGNDILNLKKDSIAFEKELDIAEQFNLSRESLELKKEDIDNFLINPEVPVNLIKFFEETAEELNLTISIFPTSIKESKNDLWNSIGFNIELLGDFSNFSKFLEKMESSHYFLAVQNIQLKKITQDELYLEKYRGFSLGQVKTVLTVKVYTK